MQLWIQALAVAYCVQFVACDVSKELKTIDVSPLKTSSDLSTGQNQQPTPECTLQRDRGDCNKNFQKYYFDSSSGRCREFSYTGCGGNLNNFVSIDKCNSRCVCSNPKDKGQGTKSITRYYYNEESGKCQVFKYRGSGGNANRFRSPSACKDACERATVTGNCKERPEFGRECDKKPTVQFYYDKYCNCCRKFTYLGCGGNGNRFKLREECQQTCKLENPSKSVAPIILTKPAICFFQNVYGDCSQVLTRYHYDNRWGRCVPFTYSGCGGNENNFINLMMCQKTCEQNSRSSLITQTINAGKVPPASIVNPRPTAFPGRPGRPTKRLVPSVCTGKPARGNCILNVTRYYYDVKSATCRSFRWSGCGGNSNRFINRDQCNKTCKSP